MYTDFIIWMRVIVVLLIWGCFPLEWVHNIYPHFLGHPVYLLFLDSFCRLSAVKPETIRSLWSELNFREYSQTQLWSEIIISTLSHLSKIMQLWCIVDKSLCILFCSKYYWSQLWKQNIKVYVFVPTLLKK